MSLRWRIALALAAIAGAVSILAAAGAYLATASQLQASIDESLLARGAGVVEPGPGRPPLQTGGGCPPPGVVQPASGAQLLTPDGTVHTCIEGGITLPVSDADRAMSSTGGAPTLRTVTIGGTDYRMLTAPWRGGGAIQIARDLDESAQVLASLRLRLGLLAVLGTALAGVLGWFIARRIVHPVLELRDVAETIATSQDLATPIPVEGSDEIGSLARSFTTMVAGLARSREQQRRLVVDASHEMRTPLTSLRTNLELLDRFDELPLDERTEVVRAAEVDVAELTNLLTELVELATDDAADTEEPEPISLVDIARDVTTRATRRTGRTITVTSEDDDTLVLARSTMVARAISNLVDNATKYSPPGEPIEVQVTGGRIEVRDQGAGIAEGDQPFVFERFYRATNARTEPGSGLGLAIVKQIVDRHGGTVWATNDPGGGARVGFEIPKA